MLYEDRFRRFNDLDAAVAVVALPDFRSWLQAADLLQIRLYERLVKPFTFKAVVVSGSLGQALRGSSDQARAFQLIAYAGGAGCPIYFVDQCAFVEPVVAALKQSFRVRASKAHTILDPATADF